MQPGPTYMPNPDNPDGADAERTCAPAKPKKRRWRWLQRALIAGTILIVGAELYCRFYLDLGDPPLLITDPEIEYLYRPSTHYHRFGNKIWFNSYSMRSDEFPAKKTDATEFRVMVLGDSLVNGGALTDQSNLVTEVLRRKLAERMGRPVVVGNISAASWGPPNVLAYVKRFGLFDADAVVVVLGSDDYCDVPTFAPLGWAAPTQRPWLALQDAIMRYVPAYLSPITDYLNPPVVVAPTDAQIEQSLQALRDLLDLIQAKKIPVAGALHQERNEIISKTPKAGYHALRRLLENRNVPIIDFAPLMRETLYSERETYRDAIHPNELGQTIMADAMMEWIMKLNQDKHRQ